MNTPRWNLVKFPENPTLIFRLINRYYKEQILWWEDNIIKFLSTIPNYSIVQKSHVNDNISNEKLIDFYVKLDNFNYELSGFINMFFYKLTYNYKEIKRLESEVQKLNSEVTSALEERWIDSYGYWDDDFSPETKLISFLRDSWINLPEFDVESLNAERIEALKNDSRSRVFKVIQWWKED